MTSYLAFLVFLLGPVGYDGLLMRLPRDDPDAPYTCDQLLGDSLCDLHVLKANVSVRGVEMFYWIYEQSNLTKISDPSRLPVIMINGGPGDPHNYLLPLKQLACTGRKIIFYDQVGTGLSSICKDVTEGENPNNCTVPEEKGYLLTLEYYPEEVAALVQELKLDSSGYHILGHSWGTIVAQLFGSQNPPGLASIVLGGALSNTQVYINAQWDEVEGNLGTLPEFMKMQIKKYEAEEDFNNPVYEQIVADLTQQFTYRTVPPPDCVVDCGKVFNEDIYVKMQGPSEFAVTDSVMYDMDLTPQLRNISVPVLLTNGKYDTMRGPNIRSMAKEIKNVELAMLDRSAHMTMIDEPQKMNVILKNFWAKIETGRSSGYSIQANAIIIFIAMKTVLLLNRLVLTN